MMKNKVSIVGSSESTSLNNLEPGQMFKCCAPMADGNVYMKIDTNCKAVLLTTGQSYTFEYTREVVPLKKGTVVSITQSGD
jgi:hypothetical protein